MNYPVTPERGIFFRLHAYKRVDISQVECRKNGKTSIEILERSFQISRACMPTVDCYKYFEGLMDMMKKNAMWPLLILQRKPFL